MPGLDPSACQELALVPSTQLVAYGSNSHNCQQLSVRDLVESSDDETGSEHSLDMDSNTPLVRCLMQSMPREQVVNSMRVVTTHGGSERYRSRSPDASASAPATASWGGEEYRYHHAATNNIDFLGSTTSLKDIMKLPYSTEAITVGLHRLGDTLILDGNMGDHELGPENECQYLPYTPTSSSTPEDCAAGGTDHTHNSKDKDKGHDTDASSKTAASKAEEGTLSIPPPPLLWRSGRFPLPPIPNHAGGAFSHHVNWQLHEMSMLLGSDTMIAGTTEHPKVSIKLHEADEQLTRTTCIDYYLDNVMENIPELALCMKSKGYIQGCRLVRTEDIPYLLQNGGLNTHTNRQSGRNTNTNANTSTHSDAQGGTENSIPPIFDPTVVELNATMLLRFLQQNCSRDGGSYLLHRAADGGAVQLYDLQALSNARQKRWRWLLAMMCYRFALRMSHHLSTRHPASSNRSQSTQLSAELRRSLLQRRRSLLHSVLDLLVELKEMGGGGHETICAAVQERLAETYLFLPPPNAPSLNTKSTKSSENISKNNNRNVKNKGKGGQSASAKSNTQTAGGRGLDAEECTVHVHDFAKAKEHLSEAIAILQALLLRRRAALETARAVRSTSKSLPVLVMGGDSVPVAVTVIHKNHSKKHVKKKPREGFNFVFGDVTVPWDQSLVPERERGIYFNDSDNSDTESTCSDSSNEEDRSEDPSTALDIASQQLLSLQVKLVGVCLDDASSSLNTNTRSKNNACDNKSSGPNSPGAGIEKEIERAIMSLQDATVAMHAAQDTLDCLQKEQTKPDAGQPQNSTTAQTNATETSSPIQTEPSKGDLGALWVGSLSETLAAADRRDSEDFSQSRNDETVINVNVDGEEEDRGSASHLLATHRPRLLELCGDAAHVCLGMQRNNALPTSVMNALTQLLQTQTPPICMSDMDPCGTAHGNISGCLLSRKTTQKRNKTHTNSSADTTSISVLQSLDSLCLAGAVCELRGDSTEWLLAMAQFTCYDRAVNCARTLHAPTKICNVDKNTACSRGIYQEIWRKKGGASNEIGQLTSSAARRTVITRSTSNEGPGNAVNCHSGIGKNSCSLSAYRAVLIVAAEAWFRNSLESFQSVGDSVNCALVLLNLSSITKLKPSIAQGVIDEFYKTNENIHDSVSRSYVSKDVVSDEEAYEMSIELCNTAHQTLSVRDNAPALWDKLNAEIAVTCLALGARRRARINSATSSSTASAIAFLERSPVLDPFEMALRIYTELGDVRQIGSTQYQLGLTYAQWKDSSKALPCLVTAVENFLKLPGDAKGTLSVASLELCACIASIISTKDGDSGTNSVSLRCYRAAIVGLLRGGVVIEENISSTQSDSLCILLTKVKNVLKPIALGTVKSAKLEGGAGAQLIAAGAKAVYAVCLRQGESVSITHLWGVWENALVAESKNI